MGNCISSPHSLFISSQRRLAPLQFVCKEARRFLLFYFKGLL
nr:MAG TPA: hypothetical protein [Caudoviricetes sp.]